MIIDSSENGCECVTVAVFKLTPKQLGAVGSDTFSMIYLWIDSLSQSWTNPMHLQRAYGSLTLSHCCLPLVCLWDCKFVTASKSMNGYFQTCSCDVFPWSRSLSDAILFASDLFFVNGNSIPRSLYDNHLVWIWCSLSYLLPATLKIVANSLSMFYRCLRFRL